DRVAGRAAAPAPGVVVPERDPAPAVRAGPEVALRHAEALEGLQVSREQQVSLTAHGGRRVVSAGSLQVPDEEVVPLELVGANSHVRLLPWSGKGFLPRRACAEPAEKRQKRHSGTKPSSSAPV